MNFINKYSSGNETLRYYYAEEFTEAGSQVIFSVGEIMEQAVISKVDTEGNLLWEKMYQFNAAQGIVSFQKIIQLSDNRQADPTGTGIGAVAEGEAEVEAAHPSVQYVLYATSGSEHWLMCINENGDVIWCRQIFWEDSDVIFHLESSKAQKNFFIVISDKVPVNTNPNPFVAKIDKDGKFMFGRFIILPGEGFIVNAARSHSLGITLGGHYTETDQKGVVIDLNEALNINTALYIEQPDLTIHDIGIIHLNKFLVSGYLNEESSLFVAEIDVTVSEFLLYRFPNTADHSSKLCPGADNFYFLQYDSSNGVVHKSDSDIHPLWTKELHPETNAGGNGINFLNYNITSGALTLNAFNPSLQSLLVHTDAELTSCKTINLDLPGLIQENFTARPVDITFNEQDINIKDNPVSIIVNSPEKTEYCPDDGGGGIEIDGTTSIQSPNFYLQSAGSTGADGSATGIHLRWIFAGALGEKHLPKGNYAATNYNFNKPNDFVKVYRASYIKAQTVLDLAAIPYLVDDANKVWLYRVGEKVFYVYFRNKAKYSQVRLLHGPMSGPLEFIKAYGTELIEIENKTELFFAAEFSVEIIAANANIKTETLSVAENALAVSRKISSRKSYTSQEISGIRLICENGRSIRLKQTRCVILRIRFEFYSDFIRAANTRSGWIYMDKYALTLDNPVAFTRLEPATGLIDGKWQRYNDNAFVNINNYKEKWNGPRESWDRNIQLVVQKYIDLSNAQSNPRALENVPLQTGGNVTGDTLELSNLDLLNIASYDYHIARMLGLGTLDVSSVVMNGQYIYIAQYITTGDLEDGGGARTVSHLAVSIPTSANDQRLPIPVNLKKIMPGAFWGTESPEPVNLTDENGYTHDGRGRYVTLYSEELPEDETNKPFYFTNRQFNLTYFTYPVYSGLEYKKNAETEWIKPELPNDPKYLNKVLPGATPHNETIPLVLPEPQKPLFIHQQRVSGTHYYSSYGINWFSRATSSIKTLSILSDIRPVNPLKPPTNINALLVRQEKPLLLTSHQEQDRFVAIPTAQDHTLIRIVFDYHSYQELIDYKVPVGANINDPNIIPADSTEIFADKVEMFFRNQVPGNVSGKALSVTDHATNPILSVIQTGDYVQTSTGDILHPVIDPAKVANYTGGLFIMGNQQFIIHQVVLPSGTMQGPEFTLYKKEISDGIITDEIPSPNAQNLQSPEIIPDGLFMAVENMQNPSSWGTPNPLPLKVNIGTGWTVHRELITLVNADASTEQHLEKTRGIWDTAVIIPVNEPVTLPGGGTGSEHRGMYKFSFQNAVLPQHAQYSANNVSVEWYQGIIRVHTVFKSKRHTKSFKSCQD